MANTILENIYKDLNDNYNIFVNKLTLAGKYEDYKSHSDFIKRMMFFEEMNIDVHYYRKMLRNYIMNPYTPSQTTENSVENAQEAYAYLKEKNARKVWEVEDMKYFVCRLDDMRITILKENPVLSDETIPYALRWNLLNTILKVLPAYIDDLKQFEKLVARYVAKIITKIMKDNH